jgi:polyphosphate kinase 2 (PPK2 family)
MNRLKSTPAQAGAGPPPKMKRKEYERQLRVLHGELVAMQEWVKGSGAKVCVVFEGRDTAGKGGTIKRITERGPSGRSPRCTCSGTSRTSRPPAR